jgi:hypothetical protein
VTLFTAGPQTITASDAANNLSSPLAVSVSAAAASHFVVGAPNNVTADHPFDLTVIAEDPYTNIAKSYVGTVQFTSTDSQVGVVLPNDYQFQAGDNGVHTFSGGVTLQTAGNQAITVTDTGNGSVNGTTSVLVTVVLSSFNVAAPASATAGQSFTVTVTAIDSSSHTATGYTGAIHFTSSDGHHYLPSDYTFLASDHGVHTFTSGVTLFTEGVKTVAVNDKANTSLTGSASVTVNPSTMTSLVLLAPTTATAGTAFTVTVSAQDVYGNFITSYHGRVGFTDNDPSTNPRAIVPHNYTFTSEDGGVHTFSNAVFLYTEQNTQITVTDLANVGFTSMATVAVNSASADHFTLAAPPTATAGVPFTVTVTTFDQYNNLVKSYAGTIGFSANGAITLPGNYQFQAGDQGVHTFTNGLNLSLAGAQTMMVFDTTFGNMTGSSNITVYPGAVATLKVILPTSSTLGAVSTVSVNADDAFGNTVTTYAGTVHFTTTDPRGIVPHDYTFVSGDQGAHVFTNLVILRTLGTQTITAADTSNPGSINGSASEVVNPRPLPAMVVVGADFGQLPEVKEINPVTGAVQLDFMAYDTRFRGGVRVAMGDIDADGVPDIITAPGPTGGPDIKVWDGLTGNLIREFSAYSHLFRGGVFVAAGDINNDGYDDIVTGADAGGGPDVEVFSGQSGSVIRGFYAYDPRFTGGVRVAVGDVNGDGIPDIITGAGPGGGPHVEVFDGVTNALIRSFFAYDSHFAGGVYVSAADTNGDGFADIVTGAGAGGGPHVEVWSGKDLTLLESFMAYDVNFSGGVRVAAVDINGNGFAPVITVPGGGSALEAKVFSSPSESVLDQFFAFGSSYTGGVYIGGE